MRPGIAVSFSLPWWWYDYDGDGDDDVDDDDDYDDYGGGGDNHDVDAPQLLNSMIHWTEIELWINFLLLYD